MSHTPGPWAYDSENNFPPAILDSDDHLVASIAQDWVDDPAANARLIAATPDLLEALELLVEDCKDQEARGISMFPIGPALAAIAKARGEQP